MRRILRILLPILVVALIVVIALSKCNPDTPIYSSTDVKGSTGETKSSSSETNTEPGSTSEAVTIEFKPTVTGIYVARDGSIRTAEITDFSNEGYSEQRYDVSTLRTYVSDWVDAYNAAKGKDAVRIESIEVSDGMATLVLYYDNLNAFMDFQGEDFGITSLKVGTAEYAARYFALTGLKDTEDRSVTPIDALQDEDVTVVAVSGSAVISFAGEVKFLSKSATLVDANTVRVNSKSDVFIIFK